MFNRKLASSHLLFSSAVLAACSASALGIAKDWNAATGMWNASANWLPNGMPTSQDSVLIGSTATAQNSTVTLNVSSTIASLWLTDGMTLDTNGLPLNVGTSVTVSGQNTSGIFLFPSRIIVDDAGPNPGLNVAGNVSLSDHGRLELSLGAKTNIGGQLTVDASSAVTGRGTINLTRNTSPAMTLNGTLSPGLGGLTINQNGTGLIDLDGGIVDDQTIDITAGNVATNQYAALTINGTQLADAFDDNFKIGMGNTLNMNLSDGWSMGNATTIDFVPRSGATYATIDGGALTTGGTWNVGTFAIARPSSDETTLLPTFKANLDPSAYISFSGSHVTVSGGTFNMAGTPQTQGEVTFYTATTYQGDVTFNGTARQSAAANVAANSTINATTFDFDGDFESTTWQISNFLTINAGALDCSTDADPAAFNGTLNIFNGGFVPMGGLEVNLPAGASWTMAGTLNLSGNTILGPVGTIYGSAMKLKGFTNVEYQNSIDATVTFDASSVTTIASGGLLRLDGGQSLQSNLITGGIVAGPGTLGASSASVLGGYGTIATKIAFEGSAALLAGAGTLQIAGDILDVGQIGALEDGTLNVTHPWTTAVANEVRLYGGTVTGGAITNPGLIQGFGLLSPSSLSNAGTINAISNGLLVIDTVAAPDLDGPNFTGTLNALQGNLRVIDTPASFAGTIKIGQGHFAEFVSGWTQGTGGLLSLDGTNTPASIRGAGQSLFGNVKAVGDCRFAIETVFGSTSTVTLTAANDVITLQGNSAVNSGATFAGLGQLRNANGVSLQALGGSNVNVRLENDGRFIIAGEFGAGVVAAKSFAQLPTGELDINIDGATAGTQYDRLVVTGSANLAGKVSIDVNGALYNPAYLVSHEVLHTGGLLSGHFSNVGGIELSPTKFLAVTYDADSVFVTAALPGDANLDGNVNFDDLLSLAQNYSNVDRSWSTGDFTGNGVVNFDDLLLIAQNYGSTLVNGDTISQETGFNFQSDWAMARSMTPEPSLLGLLGGAVLIRRSRR